MYAINVRLEKKADGLILVEKLSMPTFYLAESVQGILSEDHAAFIAVDMFEQVLQFANTDDIQVFVSAVKV